MLSVDKNASRDEINKAYKMYSRTFHPDKTASSDPEAKRIADDLCRKANEARDVLMDPAKRRLYDTYGATGLKQLTTVSKGGEDFRTALEDLQEHQANRVAEPEGRINVGVDMRDAIAALKNGKHFYRPELSMVSIVHGFSHPISKTESVFLYGFTGDSISWGPTKKHTDGLYYSDKRLPRRGVGVRYISKTTDDDGYSASLETGGASLTATLTREQRLDKVTTSEASLQADSEHGFSGEASFRRLMSEPDENKTQFTTFGRAHVSTTLDLSAGVEAISTKHVAIRAEASVGVGMDDGGIISMAAAPEVRLTWKKRSGPSFFIAAGGENNLSVGYTIFRSIDRHSHLRLGASIAANGISWNFDYHRSKQHFSIPMRVTDDIPSFSWVVGLLAAPYVADFFFRKVLWAPVRNRKLRQQKRELLNGLRRARYEQRFQKQEAEDMRRVEIEANGIVILQARYGVDTETAQVLDGDDDDIAVPKWIDVALVLQHRVHHERDHSRLVLAEDYAQIPGFFDCCPGAENKELSIHYLYRNQHHFAVFESGEPVILPAADHRSKDDWKTMKFDWPIEGGQEAAAEGVGVD